MRSETHRALTENRRREREFPKDFYALTRPANLFTRHGQERALQRALGHANLLPLAGKQVLDVGCGDGQWFHFFEALGASSGAIAGLDLDHTRIAACRARYPLVDLRTGNVAALPWGDASFDLVFQSTLFTSILDDGLRAHAVAEMRRVLRPDGAILWYDFAYDNPNNPNVRGIGRRQLQRLFGDMDLTTWRVTLAPPVVRRLVPISWTLAVVLESLRIANTHLVGLLRPRHD